MITMSIVLVSAAGTPPVPSAGSIFPQPHCLGPAPGLHTANVVLHTLHTSHFMLLTSIAQIIKKILPQRYGC